MRCGGCAMPFQKLIQALRSIKRSAQRLQLERGQESTETMKHITGLHFMIKQSRALLEWFAQRGWGSDMEPRIFDEQSCFTKTRSRALKSCRTTFWMR